CSGAGAGIIPCLILAESRPSSIISHKLLLGKPRDREREIPHKHQPISSPIRSKSPLALSHTLLIHSNFSREVKTFSYLSLGLYLLNFLSTRPKPILLRMQ